MEELSAQTLARGVVTDQPDKRDRSTTNAVGTVLTILAITVCIGLFPFLGVERLEPVGAYITGFGQVIAVIWLILTFKSQAEDVELQRQELRLQRAALEDAASNAQQSLAIQIYGHQKRNLDRVAKGLLQSAASDASIVKTLSDLYASGHGDAFLEMLCTSDELQTQIRNNLISGERLTYIYVQEFVEKYEEMAQAITRVDRFQLLKAALLSESSAQEFNILASSMLDAYHELSLGE